MSIISHQRQAEPIEVTFEPLFIHLTSCSRPLVHQSGFELPERREHFLWLNCPYRSFSQKISCRCYSFLVTEQTPASGLSVIFFQAPTKNPELSRWIPCFPNFSVSSHQPFSNAKPLTKLQLYHKIVRSTFFKKMCSCNSV